MKTTAVLSTAGAALLVCLPAAHAHHAFAANFDVTSMIEIAGSITTLRWQNPHVTMQIDTQSGERWVVESQAKNLLERTAVSSDMFAPGTTVALAGFPAREGNGIFALNALLGDGREVILRAGVQPHFSGRRGNSPENILAGGETDPTSQTAGLFRVWSMQFAGEGRWRWPGSYSLTESATAAQRSFDPITDNPLRNCAAKGMPWIMEQPFPMQIAEQNGDIVIRLEEDDVERLVHMGADPNATVPPSALGYSVGSWEGDTLVVRTNAIDYPYLNATGIPLSGDTDLVERFEVAADGSRLDYTLTITDPEVFTAPLVVNSFWVWRPGVELQSYSCVSVD